MDNNGIIYKGRTALHYKNTRINGIDFEIKAQYHVSDIGNWYLDYAEVTYIKDNIFHNPNTHMHLCNHRENAYMGYGIYVLLGYFAKEFGCNKVTRTIVDFINENKFY